MPDVEGVQPTLPPPAFAPVRRSWFIRSGDAPPPIQRGLLGRLPWKWRIAVLIPAFAVLFAFMFFGDAFLRLMRLSERSLEVAGGVILLMVAIRMIFSHEGGVYGTPEDKEPLIFPLAVPLLAGPSAMATVLLLASRQPERLLHWVAALTVAMAVSALVLLLADRIRKWVGHSMVSAIEKLMGLVLTAIAVEMILAGLKRYFFET